MKGDYDEEEVARLCQLQHSEYGDFAIRATIEAYAASFSEATDKKTAQRESNVNGNNNESESKASGLPPGA